MNAPRSRSFRSLSSAPQSKSGGNRESGVLEQLQRNALDLDTAGQVLASVGLLIILLAILFWPEVPYEPTIDGTLIYIPEYIWLDAGALQASKVELFDGPIPGYLRIAFEILLVLLCWVAILRERWIVAAATAGLIVFPWELTGHMAPMRGFLIVSLAFVVPLKLAKIPSVAKLVIAGAFLMALPFITAMMGDLRLPRLFDNSYTDYRVVSSEKIDEDVIRQALWETFLSADAHPHDTPDMAGARAFALAQLYYKREDPGAAYAAVTRLSSMGVPLNRFEQDVVSNIELYAVGHGAEGADAKADVRFWARVKFWAASVVLVTGAVVALIGPFANALRSSMQARAHRIYTASRKLATGFQAGANLRILGMGPGNLPDIKRGQAIPSIARMDAGVAIRKLKEQSKLYALVALAFLAAACVTLYAGLRLHMPAASDNAAFDLVALPWTVARFGAQAGFFPAEQLDDPHPLLMMFQVFSPVQIALQLAVIPAFFMYKSKVPVLCLLLLLVLTNVLTPQLFAPKPQYAVDRSAISEQHQALLETRLPVLSRDSAASGLRPTFDTVSSSLTGQESTNAPENKDIGMLGFVRPDIAIFTLAQIAYLDNEPARAAKLLEALSLKANFGKPYQSQRIAIIREWADANEKAVTVDPKTIPTSTDPATMRTASFSLIVISILSFLVFAIVSFFGAITFRRMRAIQVLLDRAPTVARVTPDRLERVLGN